ncbi:MAG: anti-sigma factor [Maribacter dokdonensis]|jgi:anti-sigma-K factor RskA|uniref:Anti-sigma-K factor rskA n=2 Tax=Maribacter dokdonensis TaxID=320912 RepID=A0A1H4JAM7_9FLAO|nr:MULTISPECIES: anti-sigma factor [Maribacter]HAF76867.1 RNA polymerase subunit sigma-70 [Maribacter sp.]APA63466.1 RNA polymerase subunit sigma-70 [Maribacter sp. 1_2014MBL_MicDiv]KSA11682.1 RNA polymerase sigma-70 factor [Maribacter dokdonensis DSW-8]MBU2899462.1 anti-sigma factor [Maribacter dokdonensis]MDP2527959.1 anti-sigma factor [Maribacter dokdonensis]|tara:strand:- start:2257 stop:3015 length:759 start_codon:yes stop_codon:yes gene_type:complete
MKDKIKIFLDSDLLEKYLLGTTTELESLQVERYIAMYPEVRETYAELQENLEIFAKLHAIEAPQGLKDKINARIKAERKGRKRFYSYAIAASITAILFIGISTFFWNQNQSLQEENSVVSNKIKLLEENMKEQLEDVRNQFIVLNNPQTKKYNVKGNQKAKELKAVAYINPVKKLSYINVSKLPNIPESQCFQMWAEVNGKMINLGIIEEAGDQQKLLALPYAENAVGYITIEQKGNNQAPTVENIVANIAY